MVKSTIVTYLNAQNDIVRQLFSGFRSAKSIQEKGSIGKQIMADHFIRRNIEETYVLPQIQKLDGDSKSTFSLWEKSLQNNVKVTNLLSQAERLVLNQERLTDNQQTFQSLIDEVIQLSEKKFDLQKNSILPRFAKEIHEFKLQELALDAEYLQKKLTNDLSHKPNSNIFVGNEYFAELNQHAQPKKEAKA